jgi:hypothetical protein
MVSRDDFTDEEWDALKEGPFVAGVLIVMASPNIIGIPFESIAMAKAAKNAELAGAAGDLAALLIADMDGTEDETRFGFDGSSDELIAELLSKLASVVEVVDVIRRSPPGTSSG